MSDKGTVINWQCRDCDYRLIAADQYAAAMPAAGHYIKTGHTRYDPVHNREAFDDAGNWSAECFTHRETVADHYPTRDAALAALAQRERERQQDGKLYDFESCADCGEPTSTHHASGCPSSRLTRFDHERPRMPAESDRMPNLSRRRQGHERLATLP